MPDENDIQIVPYDPNWPVQFEIERRAVLALPKCPFLAFEHFGSTSVPGLDAKPVIDMMASVDSLANVDRFYAALFSRGYRPLEGGFRFRRAFTRPDTGPIKGYNLHVVTSDGWENKDERLFRDWLRNHQALVVKYARLKKELAKEHERALVHYTNAKSGFIRTAVNEARKARNLPIRTDWSE